MRKTPLICLYIIWIIVTVCVGFHHEYWADEAQSWLIARDCPLFDLFFDRLRYEGTPALWFLILKFLQIFHYPYKYLFIVPITATTIGLYLFLFKSKLPFYIKFLFPFTFFIAYQYAIIARNYCLLFPALAFVAVIYKSRHKKPVLYLFSLALLSQISLYCYVITFILLAFYTYEYIYKKEKLLNQKTTILISTVYLLLIATIILMVTPQDYVNSHTLHIPSYQEILKIFIKGYFNHVKSGYIKLAQILIISSLYIGAFVLYCKNSYQYIFASCLNFGLIISMACVYANHWHFGYIIVTLMFTIWILNEQNQSIFKNKKTKYVFILFFTVLSLVQIRWSLICYAFDLLYDYSGSKKAYEFILKNNLNKYEINALGYRAISLQPYFNKNIYKNFDKSYWFWDFGHIKETFEKTVNYTPVVVVDVYLSNLEKYAKKMIDNGYEYYTFNGNLYAKGEYKESTALFIFVKKGLISNDLVN